MWFRNVGLNTGTTNVEIFASGVLGAGIGLPWGRAEEC